MLIFIMMPFAKGFDPVHKAIRTAARRAFPKGGVRTLRMDQEAGAGEILEQMVQRLQEAELMIADISGRTNGEGWNPNVMWEVGFSAAHRKPCVIISRGTDNLPFDIRVQRVLKYDPSRPGLRKLTRDLKDALQQTAKREELPGPIPYRDYEHYEVQELAKALETREVTPDTGPRFMLLKTVAAGVRKSKVKRWNHKPASALLKGIETVVGKGRPSDAAYWWLIVHGVLEFDQIEEFQVEDYGSWKRNVDLVHISVRGVRLLNAISRATFGTVGKG